MSGSVKVITYMVILYACCLDRDESHVRTAVTTKVPQSQWEVMCSFHWLCLSRFAVPDKRDYQEDWFEPNLV